MYYFAWESTFSTRIADLFPMFPQFLVMGIAKLPCAAAPCKPLPDTIIPSNHTLRIFYNFPPHRPICVMLSLLPSLHLFCQVPISGPFWFK